MSSAIEIQDPELLRQRQSLPFMKRFLLLRIISLKPDFCDYFYTNIPVPISNPAISCVIKNGIYICSPLSDKLTGYSLKYEMSYFDVYDFRRILIQHYRDRLLFQSAAERTQFEAFRNAKRYSFLEMVCLILHRKFLKDTTHWSVSLLERDKREKKVDEVTSFFKARLLGQHPTRLTPELLKKANIEFYRNLQLLYFSYPTAYNSLINVMNLKATEIAYVNSNLLRLDPRDLRDPLNDSLDPFTLRSILCELLNNDTLSKVLYPDAASTIIHSFFGKGPSKSRIHVPEKLTADDEKIVKKFTDDIIKEENRKNREYLFCTCNAMFFLLALQASFIAIAIFYGKRLDNKQSFFPELLGFFGSSIPALIIMIPELILAAQIFQYPTTNITINSSKDVIQFKPTYPSKDNEECTITFSPAF